ncbi:DegT/DnrJ/EryC1/StrS family aminotransferase [Patescibacteria group bacterium]|nr:DegT/DnrJ/EryC1/StrS family aminotransferase [Patescibacteria group bacterium]
MEIKFNDFQKQYKSHQAEFDQAIKEALNSGWYILGSKVADFEKKFADYIGTKYAIGVANGMEALQIALLALDIKQGDEVITTSHTAVATALAIIAVGAKPVFVDIDKYFHINANKIEEKINNHTKAIIPVHLYGQSVDLAKITAICKKHKIHLIEDCAQAHGATYKNKKVGSFGIINCFSFYPTKNLGAFGDGGAITINNKALYEKILQLRNYGQKNRYEHETYGLNSRLDEIQAAILSVQLKYLDKNNKIRQKLAEIYFKHLFEIKQIKLPLLKKNCQHVFHLFVIEAENRDKLSEYLKFQGISTLIHYPVPLHKQKCFQNYNDLNLPIIKSKVKSILSLPIHPFLKNREIEYVCKAIKDFYKLPQNKNL